MQTVRKFGSPPDSFYPLFDNGSGRAIRVLCSTGWGVEAELVLRPGLEALINLLYITKEDTDSRAVLFSEYEYISANAYINRVDRWPDQFNGIDYQQRRNKIKENFDRVKANYPNKTYWAGKLLKGGLREMARQVELDWYYEFIYWFASNHIHANARSAVEVMHTSVDGRFSFNLGPSISNTQHALLLATDFLLQAYRCIVRFFDLPEENKVTDLIAGYGALYQGFQAR